MGKTFQSISAELRQWLGEQRVFFVGTAPLAAEGHVNCSPKGADSFRVLGEREVAYADLNGSGIETIAHVQENRRIVLMFTAFSGRPRIVRLHGRAEVIYPSSPAFTLLNPLFPGLVEIRAVLRIDVTRISDSCGMAVPCFDYVNDRTLLDDWARRKGSEGLADYRTTKNATSIDGLEGYRQE